MNFFNRSLHLKSELLGKLAPPSLNPHKSLTSGILPLEELEIVLGKGNIELKVDISRKATQHI